ncbi:hypothetical protein PR048_001777 [Dryococelus australis]|uniref:Uncharacterized protein n=1 Tax=Dryococelus australis TaxID=614101 RepID=A0ABQ9IIB6_9NEOP|nr:hypothetical protein PR048_001777 [Dryococelus australis]
MAYSWKLWSQQFEWHSVATNLMKKSKELQVATFMTVIGPNAAGIYNTFSLTETEENSITVIKAKLYAHFTPKTNITYERYMFNKIVQTEDQPFDNFLTSVINQGKKSEFQEQTYSLLCDKIVVGIASDSVCERLLVEEKLTFDQAENICRAVELTKHQLLTMKTETLPMVKAISIERYGIGRSSKQTTERGQLSSSPYYTYGREIAARKRIARPHCRRSIISCLCSAETEFHWVETLTLPPNFKVNFKLHTGAQCNVITTSIANKWKLKIIPSKTRCLMHFSKDSVPTLRVVHSPVVTTSKRAAVVNFLIIDNGHQCVLGMKTCESLEFIKRLETVDTNDKLFGGIDCLKGFVYDIGLEDQPNLKVHPPRRVPYPIRNKIKEEIDSMVKSNIIAPITEPTPAISPMVVVRQNECSIDDILIHAYTKAEFEDIAKNVILKLKQAGLKLNVSKCIFNKEQVKFQGHIITSKEISPDPG